MPVRYSLEPNEGQQWQPLPHRRHPTQTSVPSIRLRERDNLTRRQQTFRRLSQNVREWQEARRWLVSLDRRSENVNGNRRPF